MARIASCTCATTRATSRRAPFAPASSAKATSRSSRAWPPARTWSCAARCCWTTTPSSCSSSLMLKFIIETCVHRRAATVFATIVVAIFGVNAYLNTPIEAYPDVTNAQVTVIAQMPGYASEEMERQVTVPLERALNGTPGMTLLRSESLFGLSLVTLIFGDDVDAFKARMLVTQRLTDADLPDGVTPVLAPDDTPLGEVYQFR